MADTPEKKTSKASVEASLASKLQVMSMMPRGFQEQALEGYANKALPDGSEQERDEFKRYWRERIDRERECSDRERERSDRAAEQQLQTLKVSSETLPRLQDRGNGEVSVDESKIAKFRLRQARLRSDNELKQHFTGVRAINRAMRDLVVDSPTQQAFREIFGREMGPADYLKLGLLDDNLPIPKDLQISEAKSGFSKPEPTAPAVEQTKDRRAAIDAFILKSKQETSLKVTRTSIWRAAGHSTARQFQFWQASDPKATAQDDKNFRRILAMNPADFEALLKKKSII
jgi:hypothetical protein